MTPEVYHNICQCFHDALRVEGTARDQYIDSCSLNSEARAHLKRMLDCDALLDSSPFLVLPLVGGHAHLPRDAFGSQAESAPPPSIRGYEIIRELGRGGMGVIYEAQQEFPRRRVALKVVLSGNHSSPDALRRFRDEAQAAAELRHPHIVELFEVGEEDGHPFFSMALVPNDLGLLIAEGPLEIRRASQIVKDVASAIEFGHRRGILHRDLKPSNILIDDNDRPLVCDFGLAKWLSRVGGMTQTGAIVGSPSYMAPEQAEADTANLTTATDVYGLGALLYATLTGKAPFRSANVADTLRKVVEDDPVALRSLRRGIPKDLETVCLKCLEKKPARRYPTAAAVEEELRRFLEGRPVEARRIGLIGRSVKWARRNKALAALFVVIALATSVGGALLYLASVRDRARIIAEAKATVEEQQRISAEQTTQIAEYHHQAVEGVRSAVAAKSKGWSLGYDKLVEAVRLGRSIQHPAHSLDVPSLRTLATQCLSGTELVDAGNLCPPELPHINAYSATYSPDGRLLAIGKDKSIGLLGPPPLVFLFSMPEGKHEVSFSFLEDVIEQKKNSVRALSFTPDGRTLVVGTRQGAVYLYNIDDPQSPPRRLTVPDSRVWNIAFHPSGRFAISTCGDGPTLVWRLPEWEPDPSVTLPVSGSISFRPDGQYFALGADSHVSFFRCDDGIAPTPVVVDESVYRIVSFAPSGQLIAMEHAGNVRLAHFDGESLNWIHTCNSRLDGITRGDGIDALSFDPTGSLLVSTHSEGLLKLWSVASGQLVDYDQCDTTGHLDATFSADGQYLAYTCDPEVKVLKLNGHQLMRRFAQHEFPVRAARYNSDGSRVYFLASKGQTLAPEIESVVTEWNRPSEQMLRRHVLRLGRERDERVFSMAVSSDDQFVAFLGVGLSLWNLNADEIQTRPDRIHATSGCCFSDDGNALWLGGHATSAELLSLDVTEFQVAAAYRPAVERLVKGIADIGAVGCGRNVVYAGTINGAIYRLPANPLEADKDVEQAVLPVENPELGAITCVAVTDEAKHLIVGTRAGFVAAVPVDKLNEGAFQTLRQHAAEVVCIAASPKRGMLATGSADGTIALFAQRGDAFEFLQEVIMDGPVIDLQFHPRGDELLVVVHGERAATIIDVLVLEKRLQECGLAW